MSYANWELKSGRYCSVEYHFYGPAAAEAENYRTNHRRFAAELEKRPVEGTDQ